GNGRSRLGQGPARRRRSRQLAPHEPEQGNTVSVPNLVEPQKLDPLDLVMGASPVVRVVLGLLLVASFAVWLIWLLKTMQVMRLRAANRGFEHDAAEVSTASELISLALKHDGAPGARVVL